MAQVANFSQKLSTHSSTHTSKAGAVGLGTSILDVQTTTPWIKKSCPCIPYILLHLEWQSVVLQSPKRLTPSWSAECESQTLALYQYYDSLSLPHAHSLSVCLYLWVYVVCVWFLLYLSLYLYCASCVFCVLFYIHITTFCFLSSFSTNLIDTYVTVPIDVHITLLMRLSSTSFCISICVIHACVYVNLYTHFLPLPYS